LIPCRVEIEKWGSQSLTERSDKKVI